MIQCRSRRAGIYKKWEERPGPAAQPGEEEEEKKEQQNNGAHLFFYFIFIKVNLEALSYLPIISLSFSVFFLFFKYSKIRRIKRKHFDVKDDIARAIIIIITGTPHI